jgi:hypothetical protein
MGKCEWMMPCFSACVLERNRHAKGTSRHVPLHVAQGFASIAQAGVRKSGGRIPWPGQAVDAIDT